MTCTATRSPPSRNSTGRADTRLHEILESLVSRGHAVERRGAVVVGHGSLPDGGDIAVVGIVDGARLSPGDAVKVAAHVLETLDRGGGTPLLLPVDTEGQLMARHAEMMGLDEYCAHLAKCLLLKSQRCHCTVGFEDSKAAAGAHLATALANDVVAAVEGASPAAMDLPSMPSVEAHSSNYDLDRLIVYDYTKNRRRHEGH